MPSQAVHFGPFTLDFTRYELTRSREPIRLERIPMDLLVLLVREGGRLVRRDEIIERLWGKDVFFDSDNSINTAIRKIRRALGEDPEKPQYIETVLGKGYRFKGALHGTASSPGAAVDRAGIMLAILPFENLSGDPGQEYFSDGLTEETIMRLSRMAPRRMGVIARTSSMVYKRSGKSIRQIGEELGVDYVLEGSVRREPDRVRVTAQLIRVKDQIHLWAENFDRPPQSILDIHGEVGTAIATQIKLQLTPEEKDQLRSHHRASQEAQDLYLRGRYHHAKVTFAELQKAIGYFRRATELDPEFAMAHAGIAESFIRLPITSDIPAKAAFSEAKAAVATALRLDPRSVEAHTCGAAIGFWFDWDFAAAEAAARRAISLNSNYCAAHFFLAHTLSNVGRHDQALATIRQALVLDPFSLIANAMYGQFLYHAGRLEESVRQFRATLDMDSRFWVAHICLAKTYEQLGMHDEALESCDKAWEFSGGNSEALSLAGYIYAISGEPREAKSKIRELEEQKLKRYVPPYNLALVCAGLGESQTALDWLEQALEDRDVHMTFLLDHKWDGLRTDPRFTVIAERCGFANARPASA